MFQAIQPAPPDAILGLTEAFIQDANPSKINLGVGVYKDANGQTPVLATVKEAERRILEKEKSKGYKPIPGDPAYGAIVKSMVFGAEHEVVTSGRSATAHTPGGTGALRVAADFIRRTQPDATVWFSDPTWANHGAIFEAAGVRTNTYAYFDKASNGLNFDAMLDAIRAVPEGDVVLLHACCHNPTGVDPSPQQWKQIGDVLAERSLVPLIDFAYQGFANGIDEDALAVRELARPGCEMLLCTSYSKNLSLYNERVGSLTVVASDAGAAQAAMSHVKICIRTNYSNPPAHGGAIVIEVLSDATLRAQWEEEVADMRKRINGMRALFAAELDKRGVKLNPAGNSFIAEQRGMFSFSGLTPEQVKRLRSEYAIYIVGSGRINVAGMTESNMKYLCDAIASVM